jgi:hypothetical protein
MFTEIVTGLFALLESTLIVKINGGLCSWGRCGLLDQLLSFFRFDQLALII